jgi:4-hydroxy-tetrahydrodipicolinate reductase
MTQVGIFGVNGRMGRKIVEAAFEHDQIQIGAASVRATSSLIGIDVGELIGQKTYGLKVSEGTGSLVEDADVWIDFTLPEALERHIKFCIKHKKNMVIGVTGLSSEQLKLIKSASNEIAIVYATNFSTGVNLMHKLLKIAASTMGQSSDIEIVETHHRFKKDAPSGTAISMGEAIAEGLNVQLPDVAQYHRNSVHGERKKGEIGFSSLRCGDVVGEHTALFADLGERLEIIHKATDRLTFAKGAVRAAWWLSDKQNGLFDMQDVLDFN